MPRALEPSSGSENLDLIEGDTAASPTAEAPTEDAKAGSAASLFDVVEAALGGQTEEEPSEDPSASDETGESDQEASSEAEESDGEADDAEAADEVDEKTGTRLDQNPRFQRLIQQKNAFKTKADRLDQIEAYLASRGLKAEHLDGAVELASALQNPDDADPEQALAVLMPLVQRFQARLGQGELPQDLQEEVDGGFVTEERARELARLRLQAESLNGRVKRQSEAQAAENARQAANAMVQAVAVEEVKWKQDPAYEKKVPLIRALMVDRANRDGRPSTPEQAKALAVWAKAEVDKVFSGRQTEPKKPVRTIVGGANKTATPKPSSLEDVVDIALKNARG